MVILEDGAAWIWNLAKAHFPEGVALFEGDAHAAAGIAF